MAVLRTWAEVEDFDGGPTEPEMQLIEACKAGDMCVLDDGSRPDTETPARTIRAEVLRYLILGGSKVCEVGERGVWLTGAYIKGSLDLDYATAHGATQLESCRFGAGFQSVQTRFTTLHLTDSALNGWTAFGATFDGNVFLTDIRSEAGISLSGARIGGTLTCLGAQLDADDNSALNVQSARIGGSVLLNYAKVTGFLNFNNAMIGGQVSLVGAHINSAGHYAIMAPDVQVAGGVFLHPRTQEEKDKVTTPFQSVGELRLNGATIGGLYAQQTQLVANSTGQTLSLGGATVNGPVRLDGCNSAGELLVAGSRISGRLTCERMKLHNPNGHAFNGQAMRVAHSFVWKKVEHDAGAISLNGAHVAELDDDPGNWPNSKNLFLDGFTYDRIKGTVSTSPARMDWLKAGSYFGDEFRPQPYSQYAKFLRDTGHDEDARRVLYTRERLRRASTRAQLRTSGNSFAGPLNLWTSFWDVLLRLVVGYGHYPFRSVAALAVLICCTIVPAHFAWEEGSFAPNAAPVIVSEEWTTLARTENQPAAVWSGDGLPSETALTLAEWQAIAPGRDWETFNRYAYGFDVVIPIIDFGQTEAWAPSTNRGSWGWHLWWGRWVLSAMGWIVTALGAAAITGIIRRD